MANTNGTITRYLLTAAVALVFIAIGAVVLVGIYVAEPSATQAQIGGFSLPLLAIIGLALQSEGVRRVAAEAAQRAEEATERAAEASQRALEAKQKILEASRQMDLIDKKVDGNTSELIRIATDAKEAAGRSRALLEVEVKGSADRVSAAGALGEAKGHAGGLAEGREAGKEEGAAHEQALAEARAEVPPGTASRPEPEGPP